LRRLRTAAVAGVLLLAGAILLSPGCQRSPEGELPPRPERPANREASEHPAVGKRLSELKVIALDDASKSVTLADLSGKVVLVDLWGPWCPPCRWELPHIAALGQKYRSSPGFQLLAVSSGQTRPENIDRLRKETRAFLKDAGLDLPTYLDPGFVTRRAFAEAGDLTRIARGPSAACGRATARAFPNRSTRPSPSCLRRRRTDAAQLWHGFAVPKRRATI
jgi:thiol-disulfide isomerase/thioredoxin